MMFFDISVSVSLSLLWSSDFIIYWIIPNYIMSSSLLYRWSGMSSLLSSWNRSSIFTFLLSYSIHSFMISISSSNVYPISFSSLFLFSSVSPLSPPLFINPFIRSVDLNLFRTLIRN